MHLDCHTEQRGTYRRTAAARARVRGLSRGSACGLRLLPRPPCCQGLGVRGPAPCVLRRETLGLWRKDAAQRAASWSHSVLNTPSRLLPMSSPQNIFQTRAFSGLRTGLTLGALYWGVTFDWSKHNGGKPHVLEPVQQLVRELEDWAMGRPPRPPLRGTRSRGERGDQA